MFLGKNKCLGCDLKEIDNYLPSLPGTHCLYEMINTAGLSETPILPGDQAPFSYYGMLRMSPSSICHCNLIVQQNSCNPDQFLLLLLTGRRYVCMLVWDGEWYPHFVSWRWWLFHVSFLTLRGFSCSSGARGWHLGVVCAVVGSPSTCAALQRLLFLCTAKNCQAEEQRGVRSIMSQCLLMEVFTRAVGGLASIPVLAATA